MLIYFGAFLRPKNASARINLSNCTDYFGLIGQSKWVPGYIAIEKAG
jgi:hypothetical protein